MRVRPACTALAALMIATALAACAPQATDAGPTSAPPSAEPTQAAPSPVPTSTVVPGEDSTAVDIPCSSLVPTAAQSTVFIDATSTVLTVEDGYVPPADSAADRIAAIDGTACQWTDARGTVLEAAVGRPAPDDLEAVANELVTTTTAVPTYGDEAYFTRLDMGGEVQLFHDGYWVVVVSPAFFEPGDAEPAVRAIVDGLPEA